MATIESIDQSIAAADADFASLSGKLLGVQDDMQYQAVTGTGGFKDPQLTGETKKVVAGVLTLMSALWIVANLVAKRIEETRTKRATLKSGMFGSSSASIKEVEDLLAGQTLVLTPEAAAKLPEVVKGRLFTQQANTTSVQVALAAIGDLLKQAALSIIQVEECKNGLKLHIAEVEKRLEEVLPIVTRVGGSALLAHSSAVSAVATLKLNYEFDPLGVNRSFDSMVDKHINTINGAIGGEQKAKEKAYASYGDAKVLMQRLEDRQPNPTRTPELREWLNKLVKRLEQEDWGAASTGLEDWIRDASSVLSLKPPAATQSNPAHSAPQAHSNPPASAPVTHQPPPSAYPPARTAPPPPVRVEQLPTSGNYTKYSPPEKSNLEKLLDGELKPAAKPAPTVEQHPIDPELDKLVSARTPPSGPPPASVGTAPNPGLDKLVNGPAKPPTAPPAASTPATQVPPPNNAALDELLNGRPKKPLPPAGQTQSGQTVPGGQPAVTPVTSTGNSALGDLIEGRKKPTPPPSTTSTGASVSTVPTASAAPVTPAAPVAPATPATPPAGSDAAKLADMFGGRKATPAPPSVPGSPGAVASTAGNAGSKPALSQAEQDEAARKALEKLLKG
ncbi:MAG: hypothetical protein KGS72_17600 [Cyanobacteria bacterium REEB67]|nr:hypothetical protein [Cyanobacteria bacterium REEB67]